MNFTSICRTTLAVFTLLAGGCANFGDVMASPSADVQTLKIVQTTPEETRMVVILLFHNPNPLTLRLTKVEYQLWVDRVTLAKGVLTSLPLIRNRQDQTIELPLVLKTPAIMAALSSTGKKNVHNYKFSGQILAGDSWAASPIRFEAEDTLLFPQMPAVRWAGLGTAKNGLKPEFGLEITNPNTFAITVRRLQGECELENVPYTWEAHPKELSVLPQQTKRIFVPCEAAGPTSARDAAIKISAGTALAYWLQGELECASPQGTIMVVIHEKGPAGKKN